MKKLIASVFLFILGVAFLFPSVIRFSFAFDEYKSYNERYQTILPNTDNNLPPFFTYSGIENDSTNYPDTEFEIWIRDKTGLAQIWYNWQTPNPDISSLYNNNQNISILIEENLTVIGLGMFHVPIYQGWYTLTVYASDIHGLTNKLVLRMYVSGIVVNNPPKINVDILYSNYYNKSNFFVTIEGKPHYVMDKWDNEQFRICFHLFLNEFYVGSSYGYSCEIPYMSGYHNYTIFVNDSSGVARLMIIQLNLLKGYIVEKPIIVNQSLLHTIPLVSNQDEAISILYFTDKTTYITSAPHIIFLIIIIITFTKKKTS